MVELTRPNLNVLDAWLVSDSENPPPDLGSSGVPNLVQFLGIDPFSIQSIILDQAQLPEQ